MTIRVGTRGSTLAWTQSGHVARRLQELTGEDVELVRVRTDGDVLTGPLSQMGGTGVFVTALRDALLAGRCDVAVHSLKDLPTQPAEGLHLVTPEREDPRDALCARDGLTLATLPARARVGTGSPRRAAQLRLVRPDLEVVDIRGNVDTRLARALGPDADLDAVVLAAAGLRRIDRIDSATELLDPHTVLPAPGQGALGVEVRAGSRDDPALAAALAALDHEPTRLAVTAERALLRRLEAGCAAPVGTSATLEGTPVDALPGDTLVLRAVVARVDGSESLRHTASTTFEALPAGSDRSTDSTTATAAARTQAAHDLGVHVADKLLARGAEQLAPLRATGTPGTGD
ncbi:hydroxymethylbilane synthase [Sediminihabitans luteus]|uniref:Porphobilinogen deaminase n=1 Tax=Sediminihabitans luteus TaxID=1138585 RepID=A0A2M9D0N0_9CELL|nr:hydroxymethylbilane synthase [Sediminihabitans luteus]PJJ77754.1 hydroxymethylbilane synthase [Sediminihabitans luteus]GIJ00019.1 porphobilinogen deaminase [Sediminihabitans luteus]